MDAGKGSQEKTYCQSGVGPYLHEGTHMSGGEKEVQDAGGQGEQWTNDRHGTENPTIDGPTKSSDWREEAPKERVRR